MQVAKPDSNDTEGTKLRIRFRRKSNATLLDLSPGVSIRPTPFVRYVLISSVLYLLSGCGKTVEFTQEVKLLGSGNKILLKRKEVFEPRITGLDYRQTYSRSEVTVVGKTIPSWKERLHPIYFGEFSAEARYFIVATIPDSTSCYQRGRPTSPYVVFAEDNRGWREISMPKYLDGRVANLLLGVQSNLSESKHVCQESADERNRKAQVSPDHKIIKLSARYGC